VLQFVLESAGYFFYELIINTDGHDGAKNFFGFHLHVWLGIAEHGGLDNSTIATTTCLNSCAVPADRDLTRLWAQCRSCCDQTVHWARAGQTEIGGLDQMVIGVNIHWTDSGLTHFEINI
jgi:hypothetical protein